jgi:hypothetical protein
MLYRLDDSEYEGMWKEVVMTELLNVLALTLRG